MTRRQTAIKLKRAVKREGHALTNFKAARAKLFFELLNGQEKRNLQPIWQALANDKNVQAAERELTEARADLAYWRVMASSFTHLAIDHIDDTEGES